MPALPVGTLSGEGGVGRVSPALAVRDDMRLDVGESAVVYFSLKLGAVEGTITVGQRRRSVDTERSEISGASSQSRSRACRSTAATGSTLSRWFPARAATPARSRPAPRQRHGEVPGRRRRHHEPVLRRLNTGLQPGEHRRVPGAHQPLRRRTRPRQRRRDQRGHQIRHQPVSRRPASATSATTSSATRRILHRRRVAVQREAGRASTAAGPSSAIERSTSAATSTRDRSITARPNTGIPAIRRRRPAGHDAALHDGARRHAVEQRAPAVRCAARRLQLGPDQHRCRRPHHDLGGHTAGRRTTTTSRSAIRG